MDLQQHLLNSPAGSEWAKIGIQHHHGINLPLFSLHSNSSFGIGEYTDLIPLIDWCNEIGFDVIQLLPLNDTGIDTSPYSALSAFALNPIHLGFEQLPFLMGSPNLMALLQKLRSSLTISQRVDYRQVYLAKRLFLQAYYKEMAPRIMVSESYQHFLSENSWLTPYALFKTLKEAQEWKSWDQWTCADITPQMYQELCKEYESGIFFHSLVQYLCFDQMEAVKRYADQKKVLLKGDIPILINRESADVWYNRNLFQMQFSAGAPPDMYAQEGQNWGFPTYNWSGHTQDDYAWWRQRLKVASQIYNLYRIDHIVGFFRIWSIPLGHSGKEGWYIPEDFNTGMAQGTAVLEMMLQATPMLPIGEDLGNVPNEVRATMRNLGICGTKVMRWERMWNEDRRFIPYCDYLPESMTTVSTHDSETLQLWWHNNPQEARDFSGFKGWEYTPELSLEKHQEILYDSHHTSSLFHINPLQEYLALIPGMTWSDPEDERINVPGIVSEKNWSYRFRNSVEEITASVPLKELMQGIK